METVTIGGIKINPVLDTIETACEKVKAYNDEFRNALITNCADFNKFIQSTHALLYYEFKGSEVVAKTAHDTLSKSAELVNNTRKVLLQHEVDPDMLRAYADTIIELGDAIRDMMRKLGY